MSEENKKVENTELTDEQVENISGGYNKVSYEDPNKNDEKTDIFIQKNFV